jgi:glutamate/tyrosine decarboxylase-like PLP-dependent enzyme
MPGLVVPGIHELKSRAASEDVDGRDQPGHDDVDESGSTTVGMSQPILLAAIARRARLARERRMQRAGGNATRLHPLPVSERIMGETCQVRCAAWALRISCRNRYNL